MSLVTSNDVTRKLAIWSDPEDLLPLRKNGFNLQFAKSVIGRDGQLDWNLIWQSKALAPRINISWIPKYALNWTLDVPIPGVVIQEGGVWQPVMPGEVYDLSDAGFWTSSDVPHKPGFLKVGRNGFSYPERDGIHILVGVFNDTTGTYDAIYVDPVEMGVNQSATYQPQEKVHIWYERGNKAQTMIVEGEIDKLVVDMSAPNTMTGRYFLSATYKYQKGVWKSSSLAAPTVNS